MAINMKMSSDLQSNRPAEYNPDAGRVCARIGAAGVFLISLAVFVKTAAPTVSFWDSGEFIACAFTLGIPHPPGAPLYLLIGRLFTMFPVWVDPAFPMNLISAITSALAVLFLYLITVRLVLLGWGGGERGLIRVSGVVGGAVAALMLAFSDTFWYNAVETEVYGFSTMLMAMSLWLGLRWMERAGDANSHRILFFIAYLMGLAGGVHLLCLLTVPTLLMLVWFRKPGILKDPMVWACAALLFVAGYSTYASLYIRSGLNPMIDENNPETWANFIRFLGREQYGAESMLLGVFDRKAPFWDFQIWTMYIKYFLAQFPVPGIGFVSDAFRQATSQDVQPVRISVVPYLLGCWGIWEHWRRDGRRFWSIAALFVLSGVGLSIYLNMEDPQPRERDYVFVGSFALFCVWMGIASAAVVRGAYILRGRSAAVVAACFLLAMPGALAASLYPSHDRTGNRFAFDYAANILNSCDSDAILFTNADNDSFPLWYQQEVMGLRQDVRVVNLSLLNTPWYIKQLRDLDPKLTIRYTDEYIDRVLTAHTPPAVKQSGRFWPEAREVKAAGLKWTVRGTPGRVLRVQDVMVLKIVDWNGWTRPVYFALTVPDGNRMGLGDYLEMEGMVFRLLQRKASPVHVQRTRKHLMDLYRFRGVSDPGVHRNRTARNLLANYPAVFLHLAEVMAEEGDRDGAYEVLRFCEKHALPPEHWQGAVLMAALMHRLDRPGETQRLLKTVLDSDLVDEETRLGTVAELQMRIGRYDAAIELYGRMIENNLRVEQALFNRAASRERIGDLAGAANDLEHLLRLTPGDREVAQALETLRQRVGRHEATDGR
ncbi:MAG: DUF2723 domain-containing protein [Candidatus Latescibacteria bacterium]|nr:DUF2723 domain-containing protein [Candidatus Latescibacterota bacterium]